MSIHHHHAEVVQPTTYTLTITSTVEKNDAVTVVTTLRNSKYSLKETFPPEYSFRHVTNRSSHIRRPRVWAIRLMKVLAKIKCIQLSSFLPSHDRGGKSVLHLSWRIPGGYFLVVAVTPANIPRSIYCSPQSILLIGQSLRDIRVRDLFFLKGTRWWMTCGEKTIKWHVHRDFDKNRKKKKKM